MWFRAFLSDLLFQVHPGQLQRNIGARRDFTVLNELIDLIYSRIHNGSSTTDSLLSTLHYKLQELSMSEVLQEIQKKLVFPIDFASQRETDRLVNRTLIFGTIAACFIGLFTQSLANLMMSFGVSLALCFAAVLPSYSAYNKRRPEWVKTKISI